VQQGPCRIGLNGQAKEINVSNILRRSLVIQFLYGNRIQEQSLDVKGHIDSKRPQRLRRLLSHEKEADSTDKERVPQAKGQNM